MNPVQITGTKSILISLLLLPLVALGSVSQTIAAVVATIPLKDDLLWQLETDVGTMHFYGGEELWTVDLLRQGNLIASPISLSGTDDARSVRHIPKTNILLITEGLIQPNAPSQSVQAEGNSFPSGVGGNSYAVDLFSGQILWKQAPLEIPDELHYFPTTKTVVLRSIPGGITTGKKAAKKPSQFTAIDLETGKVLWERSYTAQAVWVNGAFLEVVGRTTVSINAVSGKETRVVGVSAHSKSMLMAFPQIEKILAWKGKKFSLYEVPMLNDEQLLGKKLPIKIEAKELWTIKTKKKLGEVSNEAGATWGPKYVSDELLLIKSNAHVEVIDFDSGDSVWRRKTAVSELEISPAGAYGAYTKGKKLYVLNMKTGLELIDFKLPDVKSRKTAFPRIMWQGENELIIVFSDNKRRPSSITRIDVPEKSVMWTTFLPKPANYRMTGKEKLRLTGRIFLSVALTAVSLGNPMAVGYYNYYFVFIPNLNVKLLPESDAGLEALEDSLEGMEESGETKALRRYVERSRLISGILGKEGLFVTGSGDRYEIVNFNMQTGKMKTVANYSASKVHGIEPDVVYGLAIVQEENRRKINIISL